MTASAITGKSKIGGWLAARHRDREIDEPRDELVYEDFDEADMQQIQAESDLRRQVLALEQSNREKDAEIARLLKLFRELQGKRQPTGLYLSASEFARRNGVSVSTITRKFHAGKLRGFVNDKGYISIEANQVYIKYQKVKS